jgi:formate hydrogenlyase subunit 3/multisubunit Na+/H+ antiporter MnhD subunit
MLWIYLFAIIIPFIESALLFAFWRNPRWLYLLLTGLSLICFLFFLAITVGFYLHYGFISSITGWMGANQLLFLSVVNLFTATFFAALASLRRGLFHVSAAKLYLPLQILLVWAVISAIWYLSLLLLIISSLIICFALIWWQQLEGRNFWVYFLTLGAVVSLSAWLVLELILPAKTVSSFANGGGIFVLTVVFAHAGLAFLATQATIAVSVRREHTAKGFIAPLGIIVVFSALFLFDIAWTAHHAIARIPLMIMGLSLIIGGALLSGSRRNQHSTPMFTMLCNFGLSALGFAAGGTAGYLGAVLILLSILFAKLPQAIAIFTAVDVAGAKFDYNLEGLGDAMPRLQKILRFADAAEAGLPPFPGFFGRLLIIIACLQSFNFAVALVAAVLALAIFALLLNMEMRTFRGKPTLDISTIKDVDRWQVFLLASTIIVLFIMGLVSPWLIDGWQQIIPPGG